MMTNIRRTSAYQVSFLLLLALCVGCSSRLCAATYDEEKEDPPPSQPCTPASKDHIAYLAYIDTFGAPPKTPKHLMDFSKKFGTPMSWKKAASLLQHPPVKSVRKVVTFTSFFENSHQQSAPNASNGNKKGKKKIMHPLSIVDKQQMVPLHHKLPALKISQPPKLVKTHKLQTIVQQEVDEADKALHHSVKLTAYEMAQCANQKANLNANYKKLLRNLSGGHDANNPEVISMPLPTYPMLLEHTSEPETDDKAFPN